MNKLLDKYIVQNFLIKWAATLFSFIIIFLLVDIIDHLDHIMDSNMPSIAMLRYYYYSLPWYLSIGLPMSLLLATVFTMGILQKNNELTAIKASGISVSRISIPILILGIFFSIFSFFFENLLVTNYLQKRNEIGIKYSLTKSKSKKIKKRNIFRQEASNKILNIQRYNFRNKTAHNISIQEFRDGKLARRLDALKMKWLPDDNHWLLSEYFIRSWESKTLKFYKSAEDSLLKLNFNPTDLTQATVKPEEMNYWELKEFVNKLNNYGIKDPRWSVNMLFKPAFACTSILMILFGLSLSIRKPRTSLSVGIGVSIFVIFLYYTTIKTGQSLGYKGTLSPIVSVWLPNFIFFITGIYLFTKTET